MLARYQAHQRIDYLNINNTEAEEAWAAAILIQPEEVAHLVRFTPSGYRPRLPFAQQVGRWLQRRFDSGQFFYQGEGRTAYDLWQAPATTLYLGSGDCEDFAILGVSLIRNANPNCWLAVGTLHQGGWPGGHAWIEGRDRRGFFLIEGTTGEVYRYRPRSYHLERYLG